MSTGISNRGKRRPATQRRPNSVSLLQMIPGHNPPEQPLQVRMKLINSPQGGGGWVEISAMSAKCDVQYALRVQKKELCFFVGCNPSAATAVMRGLSAIDGAMAREEACQYLAAQLVVCTTDQGNVLRLMPRMAPPGVDSFMSPDGKMLRIRKVCAVAAASLPSSADDSAFPAMSSSTADALPAPDPTAAPPDDKGAIMYLELMQGRFLVCVYHIRTAKAAGKPGALEITSPEQMAEFARRFHEATAGALSTDNLPALLNTITKQVFPRSPDS